MAEEIPGPPFNGVLGIVQVTLWGFTGSKSMHHLLSLS